MTGRSMRITIGVIAAVALGSCGLLGLSYSAAKHTVTRLSAEGYFPSGQCVGASLSLRAPSRAGQVRCPCWVFRYDDFDTEHRHFVSLSGHYLGSRGDAQEPAHNVERWVSVGTSRHGYLRERQYRDIAAAHFQTRLSASTNTSRFEFAAAVPQVPEGESIPKKWRDLVMMEVPLKRAYEGTPTNGFSRSEILYVYMSRTGSVIKTKVQPCWVEGRKQGAALDDGNSLLKTVLRTPLKERVIVEVTGVDLNEGDQQHIEGMTLIDDTKPNEEPAQTSAR